MLDLLLIVDSMPEEFYAAFGDELFSIVFRLTFYNHTQIFGEEVADPTPEAKVNLIVHRILAKLIDTPSDGEMHGKLLISLGDIIYNNDSQVSTKRVARIVVYSTKLFLKTYKYENSAKFLPGTLYAMGGLLKVEGRNYLDTKRKLDTDFTPAAPVREASTDAEKMIQQSLRELSPADIKFFETQFVKQLVEFVTHLRSMTSELKGDLFKFYENFTEPDFVNTPLYD